MGNHHARGFLTPQNDTLFFITLAISFFNFCVFIFLLLFLLPQEVNHQILEHFFQTKIFVNFLYIFFMVALHNK